MRERFFHELKVVKTKKAHKCAACGNPIAISSRTLVSFGKSKYEGFYSCYFHINEDKCYIDFFDVVQPSKTPSMLPKVEDASFFGELDYESWREEI